MAAYLKKYFFLIIDCQEIFDSNEKDCVWHIRSTVALNWHYNVRYLKCLLTDIIKCPQTNNVSKL